MKIYTKQGDKGSSKINFQVLPKSDIYFETLGEIDVLNARLGVFILKSKDDSLNQILRNIQSNLMHISSYLCGYKKQIDNLNLEGLENIIDICDAKNTQLKNFILPGGTELAAEMHLIRTQARSVERVVNKLMLEKNLNIQEDVLAYLNRLSDYFFVLARNLNDFGKNDIIWHG